MTEEEKEAIETLKGMIQSGGTLDAGFERGEEKIFQTILNLIEKQSKEIKRSKEMCEDFINNRDYGILKSVNEFYILKIRIRMNINDIKKQIFVLKSMPEYKNRKLEAIIQVTNLENIVSYLKNEILKEE